MRVPLGAALASPGGRGPSGVDGRAIFCAARHLCHGSAWPIRAPNTHRCYASAPIDRRLVTLDASKRWRPAVRLGELRWAHGSILSSAMERSSTEPGPPAG